MAATGVENRQIYIRWNAQLEAKPVAALVWTRGEPRRQNGRLEAAPQLLRVVQKKEREEESLDTQKREGYEGAKSQAHIEADWSATERISIASR
jgi:hypothetical protein